VVKSAVAHFRRYLRATPRPYESDAGQWTCKGQPCICGSLVVRLESSCLCPAERVQVQLIHAKRGLEWWGMPSWPPPSAPRTSFLTADGGCCPSLPLPQRAPWSAPRTTGLVIHTQTHHIHHHTKHTHTLPLVSRPALHGSSRAGRRGGGRASVRVPPDRPHA
jgi:hypothetical protein